MIPAATCSYAPPGTYGHECGRPAALMRARASTLTRSGWFYAARCDRCAYLNGPDNAGTTSPEPLMAEHFNEFN